MNHFERKKSFLLLQNFLGHVLESLWHLPPSHHKFLSVTPWGRLRPVKRKSDRVVELNPPVRVVGNVVWCVCLTLAKLVVRSIV
jgi:hypothetical protein